MRWLVPIVALAACYRPGDDPLCRLTCNSNDECPSDLTCSLGRCGPVEGCGAILDAADVDSPDDGPPPGSCPPFDVATSFTALTPSVTGFFYTSTSGAAIYQDAELAGSIRLGLPYSNEVGLPIVFLGSSASEGLSKPRLAPDRRQVFMLASSDVSSHRMVTSEQSSGTMWGTPTGVTVTIEQGAVDNLFVPGQPTSTLPRHMIAETSSGVMEGVEDAGDGSWRFAKIDIDTGLSIRQPSLGPDGLAMVFRGKPNGGTTAIYIARRDVLGGAFHNPKVLFDDLDPNGVGDEATPSISADCEAVFVSHAGNGRVVYAK